ncbi:MAG: hypothetical protein ACLR1D_00030, partial [Dialister sp.]
HDEEHRLAFQSRALIHGAQSLDGIIVYFAVHESVRSTFNHGKNLPLLLINIQRVFRNISN